MLLTQRDSDRIKHTFISLKKIAKAKIAYLAKCRLVISYKTEKKIHGHAKGKNGKFSLLTKSHFS